MKETRDETKARMDHADTDHVLQSGFWQEYNKRLDALYKLAQDTVNGEKDVHLIFRGQGKIEAYKSIISLPREIKKILKGKTGSSKESV